MLIKEEDIVVDVIERIDFMLEKIVIPYSIYAYIDKNKISVGHFFKIHYKFRYHIGFDLNNSIELFCNDGTILYFRDVGELQIFANRAEKLKVMI